jgi:hypothetical protein
MKPWARYLIGGAVGVVLGVGLAVGSVRSGALGSNVAIGPWQTGADFGTADAGARTRAIIALRGLLALPAREARYYNAATDDAGRALDGNCRYRIAGGMLPAQWWSLTLYSPDGYLVGDGPYSIEGAALPAAEHRGWNVTVAPTRQPGHWLPSAGLDRFQLTLRTYLPTGGGRTDPTRAVLPTITREACA